MTGFEYITVPVSIILALGLGRILTAFVELFQKDKRDWIHLLWCFVLIMVALGQWFSVWRLQPNETWEGYEFYLLMLSPLLFFTAAHLLVPSNYTEVTSWGDQLEKVARPLLVIMMISMVNFWLRNYMALGEIPTQLVWPSMMMILHSITIFRPTRPLLAVCAIVWFIPIFGVAAFGTIG